MPNIFEDLVPPDMNIVCNSTSTLTLGVTIAEQTCTDPWNYYKGYGFDILLITLVAGLFITWLVKTH